MTHLMIDGKVEGSQQILQLVKTKTVLVLVFLLGGPFRVQLCLLNVWVWSERVT